MGKQIKKLKAKIKDLEALNYRMSLGNHQARDTMRRHQMQNWCRAERAIFQAKQSVEEMDADPLLTEAVILLSEAQNKVADFYDRFMIDDTPINES